MPRKVGRRGKESVKRYGDQGHTRALKVDVVKRKVEANERGYVRIQSNKKREQNRERMQTWNWNIKRKRTMLENDCRENRWTLFLSYLPPQTKLSEFFQASSSSTATT